MWKIYYRYFNKVLKNLIFISRNYYPPKDEINALIGFINSLLYPTIHVITKELKLNESISYVHEIMDGIFSLVLDFADMFKPYFLIRLLRKCDRIISSEMFINRWQNVYLSLDLKKEIVNMYRDMLFDVKKSLWGKSLDLSIRGYIKKELIRFRNSLETDYGRSYTPFLEWWIK